METKERQTSETEADQQRHNPMILPADSGLYSFSNEHDACGVGLVANIHNTPSHAIVEMGVTVLKKLMHRGAAGWDPETGDGAGLLFSLPDAFLRRSVKFDLPKAGRYGVAMLFGGETEHAAIEAAVTAEGAAVLGWRKVPVHPEAIGRLARETMPAISQLFIDGSSFEGPDAFERKLFLIRRRIEKTTKETYVCSCSSRSIVYKGLLLATQIDGFYPDLSAKDLVSPLVLVHQRYSTNTFPTWRLAHPFRYLAHNGEINTLRGNLNQLRAREPFLKSPNFTFDEMKTLLPLVDAGQSDSASLDNMLELLVASGRSLPHAMLMLIPQAWGAKYHLGHDVRGFFDYHSALQEPWDGPAAVAFSDGVGCGALLDRNGLRPARYTLTKDGLFCLASETGVLEFPPETVERKGRLRPGAMVWCDLPGGRILFDDEIKSTIARRRPYRRWAEEGRIVVNGLFDSITSAPVREHLLCRQRRFGWTQESVDVLVKPMAATGKEPTGSMGNDAALACLSAKPQLVYAYFKQLFAEVTNPPIDPIREELVMSLTTYIGNPGNILAEGSAPRSLIKLNRPVLTDADLKHLATLNSERFSTVTLPLAWHDSLDAALTKLAADAVAAVKAGHNIVVLSDRGLTDADCAVPALLAVAAVNRALVDAHLRPAVGLIIDSGEIFEVMHYALLLGFGATAICPYLALECAAALSARGDIPLDATAATENYIRAVDKGLLKTMSKMGISTLRSYRSAGIFEAVGLGPDVMSRFFPGVASRVGGLTIDDLARESRARHDAAVNTPNKELLPLGGQYKFRKDGEDHLWTPESISLFRQAVMMNDPARYAKYAALINDQARHLCTLRSLFDFAPATQAVPLSEVEPAAAIIKRFVASAMSLGALSPEAHEAVATALNSLGANSNCGEGGEDTEHEVPGPHGEDRTSHVRQVASGRFGVTIDYLAGAKEIQIKMAQGAKPGEGGQLMGPKVDELIARVRHSIPHVTLISPPPHHDIYSIEDLAELIYDLRCSNRDARISVKLVSEVGVGTIAAGVAKGHADMILISGHDGGTGATPLTSMKHAGLPWELGLAETQQTLVANKLRGRVRLQVDGQMKTGRDVMIGALLGAEEFGFGTTMLVCLGCVMMRRCHDNCCPVGVCTQDPELRKCFRGKPEYIVNFLRMVAEEVRGYLAMLGYRTLDEAIGHTEKLVTRPMPDFYKTAHLDFSRILAKADGPELRFVKTDHGNFHTYDEKFLNPPPKSGVLAIHNVDRCVGTEFSSKLVKKHGAKGLPPDSVHVRFAGTAGQSFGAFLAPGVTFELEGEVNDFLGKGLSGGTIIVRPPKAATFAANENIIAGNVVGYGGTAGRIFLNGQAGERFAIRNSGVTAVVEGVGDHGCEYMTGGRVVVLGPTGLNFAAGMTGGVAYVYDAHNDFDLHCNLETVDLETVEEGSAGEIELLKLIREHVRLTGSPFAAQLLADWRNIRHAFVRVIPYEYKKALEENERRA